MKRLRQQSRAPTLLTRGHRVARQSFANTGVSRRKQAAKTRQQLAGPEVSSSIDAHLLNAWRKPTLALTNNAAERFNRKIEKCFSGREGMPSTKSAHVL